MAPAALFTMFGYKICIFRAYCGWNRFCTFYIWIFTSEMSPTAGKIGFNATIRVEGPNSLVQLPSTLRVEGHNSLV